jgi:bifunctional UDP-N-acetylglucosamine pyrophosphorylase/glucosamine-1-phosphate N-acetyltransferase
MLPVAGKPFLEELILRAEGAGITEFVVVVGYRSDSVKEHFGDGGALGVKIEYLVQKEQLGTGHALVCAEKAAKERFLVLNGDVLPDVVSLRAMVASKELSVAAKRVPNPRRYGVLMKDGPWFESVVEKSQTPPSDLANAGIYLLDREIFPALEETIPSVRGEYELTDGLNRLSSLGKRISIVEMEEWLEVGRPWDLLAVNQALLSQHKGRVLGEVEKGAVLKGEVSVGEGTLIRSGAYIEGPVVIGQRCDIGPNCYIRAGTCLGNEVRVGNAVEVKNSIVMDGTKIGHLSYLGDSVVGANCNFGAGTIASNLRHDGANVFSYVKGEKVDSERRKLGAILGDGVKTGINTSIYPGTVIDSGYWSRPGAVLLGHISFSGPKVPS